MKALIATLFTVVLALPAWAEVEIQDVTSPKGIKAWLVEEHSIPFTALELRFRGGTSLDAPGKRGAINLMTGLIEEGAGDLDARAYARKLESLAASFGYDVGDDTLSISARFLTENRDEVIDLLRTTLLEPRFDQDAVDRVRAQVISSLKSNAKDPNSIASKSVREMIYGDHPYATDGQGTIESVSALTRDDIVDAHAGVLVRDQLYVGAVGDITAEELGALLDELLADLPETGRAIPSKADLNLTGGVTVVDFDTPQSQVLFSQGGIDRDDEDFFAAYVMNHILGGGSFESRLMEEVRVKRGLTYGVYSYLLPKDLASLYMGSVASGNDRVAEAIEVIQEEWAKVASNGVTAEELKDAQTYLTGAYPLRFDGNGQIAGIMVGMQMQDLPIDYIATRNDKVNAVTLEDIKRVAGELLNPDQLHFTVVGKPVGLETTN
ncbi:insulinase family protein [Phaeobacter gallaeciensis]|uniref:Insulinase family protein n=2 Tax=Roseobacteraceae TaxID=2854170 RepID=A0A366X6A2_9RHOB|nr:MULTISPECIES: pitrilysin family protein [Roseobacteraceae]MBT3141841.1 insulinase family protein [Falsiruegeria litorea]MBT8168812.1 insulinase family protein [Falsiruegeria litorea]RBW59940.1 insulinase family protein [Phaeobacter gallaeciensis]